MLELSPNDPKYQNAGIPTVADKYTMDMHDSNLEAWPPWPPKLDAQEVVNGAVPPPVAAPPAAAPPADAIVI